jgi:hypothetical protein
VAFLVALAFAVAASANVPVILLTIFWKRFNTTGAVTGMLVGLISAVVLVLLSPNVLTGPNPEPPATPIIPIDYIFPLKSPASSPCPGLPRAATSDHLRRPRRRARARAGPPGLLRRDPGPRQHGFSNIEEEIKEAAPETERTS